MNINNVYIANIWMLTDTKLFGDLWTGDIKITRQYIKTTIVYQKKGNWYDLYTN